MKRKPDCHPERPYKAKGYCHSCYDKARYRQNPAKAKEKHRRWAQGKRDHLRRYAIKRKGENPVRAVLTEIKRGAARRGIPFDLSEEDLRAVWRDTCPVFGYPIGRRSVRQNDSLSVDRIDSTLGYVPGNICVMSWRANRLKFNATVEELEAVCRYMRSLEPALLGGLLSFMGDALADAT